MSEEPKPYTIELTRAAARVLRDLPEKDRNRVETKIAGLSDDPRPRGVEKLTDRGDLYRVRAGDYRVVYGIDDKERIIDVQTIGHRRDVYRN